MVVSEICNYGDTQMHDPTQKNFDFYKAQVRKAASFMRLRAVPAQALPANRVRKGGGAFSFAGILQTQMHLERVS